MALNDENALGCLILVAVIGVIFVALMVMCGVGVFWISPSPESL